MAPAVEGAGVTLLCARNSSPHELNSSGSLRPSHLVPADALVGPVDVEQGEVIPLTGDEFLPDSLHLIPLGRGVVEDTVHRQQGHDGQDLLCTVELGGQEDGLHTHSKIHLCSTKSTSAGQIFLLPGSPGTRPNIT